MRNLTKSVTAFHYLCFHACIIIDIHLMNGTFPVEIPTTSLRNFSNPNLIQSCTIYRL